MKTELKAQELDEKYRKAEDLVKQNSWHIHRAESHFGITRLPPSIDVFQRLHKPIEFLLTSTEIYDCPPVLLSEVAWKNARVWAVPGGLRK